MKIGIVCFPTYGGSGVVASELAGGLSERGHAVHLFSSAPPFRLRCADRLVFHPVEPFTSPAFGQSLYTLDLAARILSVSRAEGIDLVHAHYAIPHSLSAILARDAGGGGTPPKVVTTLHGTDITLVGSDPGYAPLVAHAIAASDAVTAVSEDLAARTREELPVDRAITVIPNFVDGSRFQPRAAPCPDAGPFRILHVSNFRPLKRAADTVRVLAEMLRADPSVPARLDLAGDGPDLEGTRLLAERMGLAARVRFLGRQDRLEEVFPCADLLLLTSASESFGLVALEAMASGLPVVATDCGGIREVVVHGETGYLEPVGDVQALARRCLELAREPARSEAFGKAGRARSLALFSLPSGIDAYERLYAGVLWGTRP